MILFVLQPPSPLRRDQMWTAFTAVGHLRVVWGFEGRAKLKARGWSLVHADVRPERIAHRGKDGVCLVDIRGLTVLREIDLETLTPMS